MCVYTFLYRFSLISNKFSTFHYSQVEDLNATVLKIKDLLAEKDSTLVTYKGQVDQQTLTITDLQKQISEYKDKNNVSNVFI